MHTTTDSFHRQNEHHISSGCFISRMKKKYKLKIKDKTNSEFMVIVWRAWVTVAMVVLLNFYIILLLFLLSFFNIYFEKKLYYYPK